VLVKPDSFRPIKVDGNPEHPMSKGKFDAFTQARCWICTIPPLAACAMGEFRDGVSSGGICCGEEDEWRLGLYFLS
jgi:hypothetical protein